MSIHLARVYTRTGDAGTTALGSGTRVPKTDPRIIAYADVDECNAAVGVALALGKLPRDLQQVLTAVQQQLFDAGADLCHPVRPDPKHPPLRVTQAYLDQLERWCDEWNAGLPELDSFVLPGGTPGGALLHAARTVARRAERSVWALVAHDPEHTNRSVATYLNRLSDLLFILARAANPAGEVTWTPGQEHDRFS